MPEFRGFEGNEAVVFFPNARTHKHGGETVPNPHEKRMGEQALEQFVQIAERQGKDPSFFIETLTKLSAHNAAQEMTAGPEEQQPAPAATPKPPKPESPF